MVAVVPAGTTVADSPQAIGEQAVALPLMEDGSTYEEMISYEDGAPIVLHRLTITMARDEADSIIDPKTSEAWSREGTAAVVITESGESLCLGWSERWRHEQPLRLIKRESTTASSPAEIPRQRVIFEYFDDTCATRLE